MECLDRTGRRCKAAYHFSVATQKCCPVPGRVTARGVALQPKSAQKASGGASGTVTPRGAAAKPRAAATKPKAAAAKPRASATKPKAAATKPRASATKPKAAAAKPKAAATKPKAAAAKPRASATKPRAAAAKPKAAAAKPRASATKAVATKPRAADIVSSKARTSSAPTELPLECALATKLVTTGTLDRDWKTFDSMFTQNMHAAFDHARRIGTPSQPVYVMVYMTGVSFQLLLRPNSARKVDLTVFAMDTMTERESKSSFGADGSDKSRTAASLKFIKQYCERHGCTPGVVRIEVSSIAGPIATSKSTSGVIECLTKSLAHAGKRVSDKPTPLGAGKYADAFRLCLEGGLCLAAKVIPLRGMGYAIRERGERPTTIDDVMRESGYACIMGNYGVGPHFFGVTKCYAEGAAVIFTELWDGTINHNEALPPAMKKKLISQVQKMHDLGLLHRDLHPGNILVRRSKKGGKVTDVAITDFGAMEPIDETINLASQDWNRLYGWLK